MYKLVITSLILLLKFNPTYLYAQETREPFGVSPFIGDKLDKIEEDYFHIFPGVSDFQEATFYLNSDSSLQLNLKCYFKNAFVDSTLQYNFSLSHLRNRINQVILRDIQSRKVQKLEFSSDSNLVYEGNVYSFNGEQIKLFKYGFADFNNDKEKYLSTLEYSKLKTVTINEHSIVLGILGCGVGILAGAKIGPAVLERGDGLDFRDVIGGVIGGISGFVIGSIIKIPFEYDLLSPEGKQIIYENSLLPSGL